jgi:Ca2+-binding RTX toxin-like protein
MQKATVLVVGVRLNRGVLEVVGTSERDYVNVRPTHNVLRVTGTLGNSGLDERIRSAGVQRMVAHLGDGNDLLFVDGKVRRPLLVQAGAGSDRVMAGGGNAMILGGPGNDVLTGGKGRDVLIGGDDSDQLSGGGGSDLLIGGTTNYDDNEVALEAILAEWTSSRTLAQRAANLRTGSGPVLSGQAISLTLDETISDDSDVESDDSDVDHLLGGGISTGSSLTSEGTSRGTKQPGIYSTDLTAARRRRRDNFGPFLQRSEALHCCDSLPLP